MDLYDEIIRRREKIAVIGLGYVGIPLAVEFAKRVAVIGFDVNEKKVERYRHGEDVTNEVGYEALKQTDVDFTSDPQRLKEAMFFVVAVPTPIKLDKTPDLLPVIEASVTVGKSLRRGSVVIYESTVYPGTTEEVCAPILERESGLVCGRDFKIGYSPERVNPADRVHTLRTIRKIVSACDTETLETVAKLYELVVDAGIHKASSIKVAEAAKVAENSQRDINIAFMNELSIVFDRMDIDTAEVLDAMNTKWNALGFSPGLVGGHCIGVDPYYFIYKAELLGYHSQIILAGRQINDSMAEFVAQCTLRKLIEADKRIKSCRVAVLGITFKENCGDIRNSKIIDVITALERHGIEVTVTDPIADPNETKAFYDLTLTPLSQIKGADAVILAVKHREYEALSLADIQALYGGEGARVLIDIKGMQNRLDAEEQGFLYWRM